MSAKHETEENDAAPKNVSNVDEIPDPRGVHQKVYLMIDHVAEKADAQKFDSRK